MARSKSKASKWSARSARAWALAGKQHGLLSRGDLLALGFSRSAIEHRLMVGRLHFVARGIYAVGWPHLTQERRWMAAVLACGPTAALSHRSAAALWGMGKERARQVDVSVNGERCRPGVRARIRPALPATEIGHNKED